MVEQEGIEDISHTSQCDFVRIKKRKSHLEELGGEDGELSCLADPIQRRESCRGTLLYCNSRRKNVCSPSPLCPTKAHPMRESPNSGNEKPPYLECPLPTSPLSLVKERISPLFCRLAYGFGYVVACLSQIVICCYT